MQGLGHTNIRIRHEAIWAFLVIIYSIKQTSFFKMILPYIYNNNWHIREEILNLMIISFLWGPNEIDSSRIIDTLATCLNDEKPKIKFVAREALAALCFKGLWD